MDLINDTSVGAHFIDIKGASFSCTVRKYKLTLYTARRLIRAKTVSSRGRQPSFLYLIVVSSN